MVPTVAVILRRVLLAPADECCTTLAQVGTAAMASSATPSTARCPSCTATTAWWCCRRVKVPEIVCTTFFVTVAGGICLLDRNAVSLQHHAVMIYLADETFTFCVPGGLEL